MSELVNIAFVHAQTGDILLNHLALPPSLFSLSLTTRPTSVEWGSNLPRPRVEIAIYLLSKLSGLNHVFRVECRTHAKLSGFGSSKRIPMSVAS